MTKVCLQERKVQIKFFWAYYWSFIKNNIFQFWTGCIACEIFCHNEQFFIFDIQFFKARQTSIWVDQKLFNIINMYTVEVEIAVRWRYLTTKNVCSCWFDWYDHFFSCSVVFCKLRILSNGNDWDKRTKKLCSKEYTVSYTVQRRILINRPPGKLFVISCI